MSETTIQWTDKTWNPVTGCQKISPGCKHCYAETIAERFWAKQYAPNGDGSPRKFTDVRWHEDRLDQPLKWKKPSMIFVNSMADLFHEDVPDAVIDRMFAIMALSRHHTFQILTKRPDRMLRYLSGMGSDSADYIARWDSARKWLCCQILTTQKDRVSMGRREYVGVIMANQRWPLPNVWLGVSVENQKYADERIPILLQVPSAVRWISAEPLLGPVTLNFLHYRDMVEIDALNGTHGVLRPHQGTNSHLNWVVVGGESGAGARPMEIEWARSLRDQCRKANVPFFMKQLGGVRDSRGELNDFPEDLRVREYPA